MHIHLMLNEKFTEKIIAFINKNFPLDKNYIYIYDGNKGDIKEANVKYTNKIWLIYDVCGNLKKVSDDPNSIYYKCPVLEYELNEDLIYVKVQKE